MENIDNKTAETQNNLKDLQHVTNTFDDKVANFSKSLRMEFRETKDDMVKKIDEHVQLAIQESWKIYYWRLKYHPVNVKSLGFPGKKWRPGRASNILGEETRSCDEVIRKPS